MRDDPEIVAFSWGHYRTVTLTVCVCVTVRLTVTRERFWTKGGKMQGIGYDYYSLQSKRRKGRNFLCYFASKFKWDSSSSFFSSAASLSFSLFTSLLSFTGDTDVVANLLTDTTDRQVTQSVSQTDTNGRPACVC